MTVDPVHSEHAFRSNGTLDDIELDPVIKSNWKTKGAREYWSDKISTFVSLIPEFVRTVVTDDDHPRDAFIFDSTSKAQDAMKLDTQNSPVQVLINKEKREDRPYGMFTDYTNAVSMVDGELSDEYLIVAKNPDTANKISQLLYTNRPQSTDYEELADHFGYPDCCRNTHSHTARHGHSDPAYRIACNTESTERVEGEPQHVVTHHPDPFLNQTWRFHGFRFSYHLPCSYDCDPSGQLARTNYEIYKQIAGEDKRDAVNAMLSWLDLPSYLSAYHGLTHIKNAYAIGSYHTDSNWEEKQLIWMREHNEKPELEVNHPTTQLEDIDPEAGAL